MARDKNMGTALNELFPTVLPKSPGEAINGTELIEALRKAGLPIKASKKDRSPGFTENALRARFSYLSSIPNSMIAKKDQGQGYYHRQVGREPTAIQSDLALPTTPRDNQREEKFRAIFRRWSEKEEQGVVVAHHIEHTAAKKQSKGINQWKFPDVVLVNWHDVDNDLDTEQSTPRLNPTMITVKQSLGEPPCKLTSVELKVQVDSDSLRGYFFQCVSNSRWAHTAQLAIANAVSERIVADELRRLGASYGVKIASFGLENLDTFPSAPKIMAMKVGEFEQLCKSKKLDYKVISPGIDRETLDWEHIKDVQNYSDDFRKVFEWIKGCLKAEMILPHNGKQK